MLIQRCSIDIPHPNRSAIVEMVVLVKLFVLPIKFLALATIFKPFVKAGKKPPHRQPDGRRCYHTYRNIHGRSPRLPLH